VEEMFYLFLPADLPFAETHCVVSRSSDDLRRARSIWPDRLGSGQWGLEGILVPRKHGRDCARLPYGPACIPCPLFGCWNSGTGHRRHGFPGLHTGFYNPGEQVGARTQRSEYDDRRSGRLHAYRGCGPD
jgi:hypothetical protein